MTQYQQFTTRKELCKWLGLPRSVSYYRARDGKPGAKASQVTMKLDGALVPNEDVVIRTKSLLIPNLMPLRRADLAMNTLLTN